MAKKEALKEFSQTPEEELAFLRKHYAKSGVGLKFDTAEGEVVLFGTLTEIIKVEKHLDAIREEGYQDAFYDWATG